ncbi:MAG: flippase-like domain-containing protein [candidate division Zixibacteria bacterium]|nr:flippase-like domain-containing protein [candidate division Zixibacteria bacterium]
MNIKTIFKSLFIVAALSIMGYYFQDNWASLQEYEWDIDIKLMLLSSILLWFAISGYIFVVNYILKKLTGVKIRFIQMYRIINITNIGRYLPGKLWNMVGFFMYVEEYGLTKKQITLSIMASEVAGKGGALFLGLFYFLFSTKFQNLLPLMIALLAACLIVMHPRVLEKIVNIGLKILKKQPVKISFSYGNMLVFFLIYIGVWLIYSLAFYTLVKSITPVEINFIHFMPILPMCWVVGYIMLFAPGGIGIREGMLTLTLSEFMSPEIALTIALAQRIWTLGVEGLNFLHSMMIKSDTMKK